MEHHRLQQSEFTTGRSTADAILALRLLSEVHQEFNRPLYVGYVDLKSAFDSVDREALWKAVRGVGARATGPGERPVRSYPIADSSRPTTLFKFSDKIGS